MNKLLNDYNRGFSLKNDDLRFIDAAVRLALADICKALGGEAAILWGCGTVQTGTELAVSEGAIFYNNEIWHVPAHTAVVADPIVVGPYWCFATTYDAAGAKLDVDLVSHNTYQVRTAFANATGAGSGVIASALFSAIPRFMDVMMDTEHAVLSMNGTAVNVDADAYRSNKMVTFSGKITASLNASNDTNVMDVPSGFKPAKAIRGYLVVEKTDTHADYMARFTIDTIGRFTIILLSAAPTGDYTVYLTIPAYKTT